MNTKKSHFSTTVSSQKISSCFLERLCLRQSTLKLTTSENITFHMKKFHGKPTNQIYCSTAQIWGEKTKFSLQKGDISTVKMRYVDDKIMRLHLADKEGTWSCNQLGESPAGGVRPVNLRIDISPIALHDEGRRVSQSPHPCAWRKYWFKRFLSW